MLEVELQMVSGFFLHCKLTARQPSDSEALNASVVNLPLRHELGHLISNSFGPGGRKVTGRESELTANAIASMLSVLFNHETGSDQPLFPAQASEFLKLTKPTEEDNIKGLHRASAVMDSMAVRRQKIRKAAQ